MKLSNVFFLCLYAVLFNVAISHAGCTTYMSTTLTIPGTSASLQLLDRTSKVTVLEKKSATQWGVCFEKNGLGSAYMSAPCIRVRVSGGRVRVCS